MLYSKTHIRLSSGELIKISMEVEMWKTCHPPEFSKQALVLHTIISGGIELRVEFYALSSCEHLVDNVLTFTNYRPGRIIHPFL